MGYMLLPIMPNSKLCHISHGFHNDTESEVMAVTRWAAW